MGHSFALKPPFASGLLAKTPHFVFGLFMAAWIAGSTLATASSCILGSTWEYA
jgi:hypothetical protein